MARSDNEESATNINTQLNKSMVLMENVVENARNNSKRKKSIKINTVTQPNSASNSPVIKSRKSILKKSNGSFARKSVDKQVVQTNGNIDELNCISQRLSLPASALSRPRNLQELGEKEILDTEFLSSAFSLEDISDNEDVWIMDIPKSMDPQEFHGQTVSFGDKSKIKIKEKRYYTVTHSVKYNITCVLNARKATPQLKTVNIKPAGLLTVRRKLSGLPKIKPVASEDSGVPFPNNLRIRHPLFGVLNNGKLRRASKKHRSRKSNVIT